MAHRIDKKQVARAARLRAEEEARRTGRRQKMLRNAGFVAIAAITAVLVAFAIALNGSGALSSHNSDATTPGPVIGATAPSFSLTDVVSGKQVSLQSLEGHKTLMFFSEGVSCAPCMEQAADLQKSGLLQRDGLQLVSVTTDQPSDLQAAAKQYGITTPLLADPSTTMSKAYGMLSHGGMQMPGQDGHAFMLIDANGKVLWHQAYQSMYVNPTLLMADMSKPSSASTMGMSS